mgnify:CR=1 FL=1
MLIRSGLIPIDAAIRGSDGDDSPIIPAQYVGLDRFDARKRIIADLEAHYLAGGSVDRVVRALISADKANIELPFQRAAAIDLAGRNVFEAVQMSVNPKVITTPGAVPRVVADDGTGSSVITVTVVDPDGELAALSDSLRDRLIGKSRDWFSEHDISSSWFVSDATLMAALEEASTAASA